MRTWLHGKWRALRREVQDGGIRAGINLVARRLKPQRLHAVKPEHTSDMYGHVTRFVRGHGPMFTPWREHKPGAHDVRIVAFYLPQFHPIPENDAWWGRGFTEWTNVTRAVPEFEGHQQPRLAGELGFYDLRTPGIQRRQVELARNYGVSAFCFYAYWFGGKRLLEAPLDGFLADKTLNLGFCVCWANENWTRTWDGREKEVLIAQQHSPEDDIAYMERLTPFLRDPRYVRVDGKPLVLVYRPMLLPDPAATAARWRDHCRRAGIGEIHLAYVKSFETPDPERIGFDGSVEFPPLGTGMPEAPRPPLLDRSSRVHTLDYAEVARRGIEERSGPWNGTYRGVMPSWDNTARKPGRGHCFIGSTPALYEAWLRAVVNDTRRRAPEGHRLVFVNAWNEWAEGAYLEPDRWNGYAFLEATRSGLEARL